MSDKNARKPLILVDGSSYLFRAFHALPPLINSHGEPTGAMHGVLNMLDKLRKDYEPEYMGVVFDAKGKTFRNDMYPLYKANRPPMPDDLRSQIEPLHDIIRAEGYPLIIIPDVEADDVIGTLATEFDGDVIISTGDKDMAQLVNDRVSLINTMSNTFHDRQGVIDKYGVPPELIRDYLALMGDKVDNVPGVNKVGPKTAVKWLTQYDSLQDVIDNADKFKGKVGEYLREALEFLPLGYDLVTIKCDVEMDCHPDSLSMSKANTSELKQLFERYGFRTRLARLDSQLDDASSDLDSDNPTSAPKQVKYETILTKDSLSDWLKQLESAELIAFDTETTSLNYMQAEVVGLCFSTEVGKAAYLPLAHDYEGAPKQLDRETTLALFKPLLENPDIKKVGQNLKYDRSVLLNHDIELKGILHDTMLESYVYNSTSNRHDMDTLSDKYLDHKTIHFEDIAGKGKKQLTFNQIDLEQAAPYAAEDADITLRLHQTLWSKLQSLRPQQTLYQDIEIPLVSVLSDIERNGVRIDANLLATQSAELEASMATIQQECFELAGEEFTLNSPKQLQAILFEKLEIPVIRKTPKGQPSTAEDVLQELSHDYPLPALILQYRSMTKLKSTYTDKLPKLIDPNTQRIHTSYHQAVTATGRLSSSDPNLQNIPIRSAEGRRIRQAFIPEDGYTMVAADYSQIELRIMAHLSGDKSLLSAFAAGEDIHSATASQVFDTPLIAVTPNQRRNAKAINFGLIYGMSAFGLAKQLGVARKEAQQYVDQYFTQYPGVQQYMDNTREKAHEQGYVETLFGRRLYLPDIKSRNHQRRQYAERTAINAPMQGTAADIIKMAMLKVHAGIREQQRDARIIMQVHDELVFEVNNKTLQDFCNDIKANMEAAATLNVPLIVDIGTGKNWDEAH
ncbi:MAG: DNA polymerase I (EC [uncultured Thiotrichaceae bacterium]|uniref:DNA polymerase I n=1 Tax=uncultured Thiotrichaceae bacterium TaxID=298394 RepID=A0A6S6UIX2_9GAMM|nr:MAG: DNA polymerase I (EC [uncultured Thiotrichaceae bacterium]